MSMSAAAKTRLISAMRTPRSRTTAALSVNWRSSSSRRPKSFSSIAPLTLNRSVIALPSAALPSICCLVRPDSRSPTHRDSRSSSGKSSRHSTVTCQLRTNIAAPTTRTLIELETVLDSVEVKAR